MEYDSFKADVFQLKAQNIRLANENNLLKEKLKKLEESIDIKHNLIESLVDPKKSIQLRNQNNSYIVTLREENEKLKEVLREKTFLIKKLHHDLDYTKSFINKTIRSNKFAQNMTQLEHRARNNEFAKDMTRAKSEGSKKKRGRSPNSSLIENKAVSADYPFRYQDTPKYLRSTSPLEEIQQLHTYFTGIIEEVKNLKDSIFQIQNVDNKNPVLEEKPNVNESSKVADNYKTCSKNTNTSKMKNRKPVVKKIYKSNKNMKNGESSSSSSVCIQMQNNKTFKQNKNEPLNENKLKKRLEEIITKLQ